MGLARHPPDLASFPGAEFLHCDIENADLTRAFRGAQAVIHLAWSLAPGQTQQQHEAVNVGGSQRVLEAVARARVPSVLVASSIGCYAPGRKDIRVSEAWPTTGVAASPYSRQKAAVERIMDRFERDYPALRLVRLRPAFVLKAPEGLGIERFFLGRPWPKLLFQRALIPFVPRNSKLRFQAVHSSDVAEAFRLALIHDVKGAFNLAAEPILDADSLAAALAKPVLPVPSPLLHAAFSLAHRLRWQPADPSWLELVLSLPLVSSERARAELGWSPAHTSLATLLQLFSSGQDDVATEERVPVQSTRRQENKPSRSVRSQVASAVHRRPGPSG